MGSLGTHNTLGLAKAKGARYLLASTSEVYGDPLVHPQPESYWGNVNPVGPRGVYDEAKRFAEAMAMAYHRYHGLDVRIVRIFNTYGPRMRQRDGRVVPAFIQQALAGRADDRLRRRRADALLLLRRRPDRRDLPPAAERPGAAVQHRQPARDDDPRVRRAIRELTGSASEIVFEPLPVDDPKTRQPDITLARERLGWEPRVPLEVGLRATVEYFRELAREGAAGAPVASDGRGAAREPDAAPV